MIKWIRRSLRVLFWLAVVSVLVLGLVSVLQRGDLTAVCREAGELRNARLLDASRQLYSRVADADASESCARTGLHHVTHAERVRDLALMRARLYRRAAHLERGKPIKGARRTAYFRALRAYITAFRRDGYAVGAREDVRELVLGQVGPASLKGYERRCALGARLTNAGLLSEANAIFATALRSGKRPLTRMGKGCRAGVKAVRSRRAKALQAWRQGQLEEDEGNDDQARAAYIDALGLDSSLIAAQAGRARVGPSSVHGGVANAIGTAAREGSRWTEGAAKWVGDRPAALVAAAALLALIALVAIRLFYRFISYRWVRKLRLTLTWFPLKRFTSTTAEVTSDADGANMSTALIDVLLVPPAAGDYGPDVQPPSEDVLGQALDEVFGTVTQLQGLVGVVKAARRLVPSRRFVVRGELIPAGPGGIGYVVHISDWRGRRIASRTFWSRDWAPPTAQGDDAKYYVANAAGWWVRWRLDS
jgi:hypothetical protein